MFIVYLESETINRDPFALELGPDLSYKIET